jgi:hypothetical protein
METAEQGRSSELPLSRDRPGNDVAPTPPPRAVRVPMDRVDERNEAVPRNAVRFPEDFIRDRHRNDYDK